MSKPRKKKILAVMLSSQDAMVGALNRYIELSLALVKRQAAHEEEIAKLRTDFDASVQSQREEMASLEASIHLYAANRRDTLFGTTKKSIEFSNAVIGFKQNPPSVGKVLAKDTWEAIADRLDALPVFEKYVAWTATVKKAELLLDRRELDATALRLAGIQFEQQETFYIEPKSDLVDRSSKLTEAA